MKICKGCEKDLPIDCFEFAYSKKNRHKNPTLRRNQCKKCRLEINQKRIAKDPDFYKKQYASMSEEERGIYVAKKSLNNQLRFRTNPDALARKKLYDKTDMGIYNRYRGDCNRRGRKDKGVRLDLTFEHFSKLINSECIYCGKENCRGVDRVDSYGSYTVDNSVSCCTPCNGMKSDLSLEQFKERIAKIYNKLVK